MEARHDDPEIEDAEINHDYRGKLDCKIVRALRKVMNTVRNAVTHQGQLSNHRGLNFERLCGKRNDQYSMRLNDQWRLVVEFERQPGQLIDTCVVKAIEDYHRG